MRLLINILIFSGSALMVYNIIRYGKFVQSSLRMEHETRKMGSLIVPLLLLIFFLTGYVIVGVSGIADLMIAAILFGGSVFVFLLLSVMYSIISHTRETDQILSARYEEMKENLQALTKDSLAVLRVNLTTDEIEERAGDGLYDSDYATDSYSELMEARQKNVIDIDHSGMRKSLFTREGLLNHYRSGQTNAFEIALVRRKNGEAAFVRFEATLTKKPVSGDIIAFLVERLYNEQVVHQTLLERVLMNQYDRIASLIDGKYSVLISNDGKKTGLLLPAEAEDTYESLYLNYILPAQPKDESAPTGQPNPLRLSVIDKALAENESYEVNAPFVIDGETRFKHFSFYRIDRKAKFYLMLLSDSTAMQEERPQRKQTLTQALKQAEDANRARIKFFTSLSHDLRTPMNGILGFSDLAKKENDPQKLAEYLEKVDFSCHQLISLMDDLFTMSLIDSGELKICNAPTDLRLLAEELKKHFSAQRPEKNLDFRLDLSELRDPVVQCDEKRISQILNRLLQNSCCFTPQNETFSLSISQPKGQDGKYVFCVRNDGCTIPQEIIDSIFEADAWKREDLAEDLPGVGLGMAVAKELVDRMGGTIEPSGALGKQTEICMTLDLEPVAQHPEVQEKAAAPQRKRRLLLVDDNAVNREIAELMLTAEGYEIEKACDGAEAVEKVSSSEPGYYDLVLMDVQMPVLNGYEATKKIRALPDPALAGIPIIALTANAYQEDADEAQKAGMNGYATKPFDPEKLRKTIESLLQERDNA